MENVSKKIDDLADLVIAALSPHMAIHRYDAYSTESVYLKFDWGVANSLRISGHPGYGRLRYRFNLMLGQSAPPYSELRNGYEMRFFGPADIDALVKEILARKAEKQARYADYAAVMAKAERDSADAPGFWRGARRIS